MLRRRKVGLSAHSFTHQAAAAAAAAAVARSFTHKAAAAEHLPYFEMGHTGAIALDLTGAGHDRSDSTLAQIGQSVRDSRGVLLAGEAPTSGGRKVCDRESHLAQA